MSEMEAGPIAPIEAEEDGLSRAEAQERLAAFQRRFGAPHLWFAWHAAFPQVLTPGLLNLLHLNFARDLHAAPLNVPWVAIADLLLSDLCRPLGGELFELYPAVRQVLLEGLLAQADPQAFPYLGPYRLHELSAFTLAYIGRQLASADPLLARRARLQELGALAQQQPKQAVRKFAEAIRRSIAEGQAGEQLRLARLAEQLHRQAGAPGLQTDPEFGVLVRYLRQRLALLRPGAAPLESLGAPAAPTVSGVQLPPVDAQLPPAKPAPPGLPPMREPGLLQLISSLQQALRTATDPAERQALQERLRQAEASLERLSGLPADRYQALQAALATRDLPAALSSALELLEAGQNPPGLLQLQLALQLAGDVPARLARQLSGTGDASQRQEQARAWAERLSASQPGHERLAAEFARLAEALEAEAAPTPLPALRLDPQSGRAWASERQVSLSDLEFRLLLGLARQAGQVVGYAELQRAGWPTAEADKSYRQPLNDAVRRIRGKLRSRRAIESVAGQGYRLAAPVQIEPPAQAISPPQAAPAGGWLNFDLAFETRQGEVWLRLTHSPAGEAVYQYLAPHGSQPVSLPSGAARPQVFEPRQLKQYSWLAYPRLPADGEREMRALGEQLFQAAFPGPLLAAWRASLAQARSQQAGLRLSLHLPPHSTLDQLPWELLYDPTERRYLAIGAETPLLRFQPFVPESLPVTLPLRLLLVFSAPHRSQEPRPEALLDILQRSLQPLARLGLIHFDLLKAPSRQELAQKLDQGFYHLLHWLGVAEPATRVSDPGLLLFDRSGGSERLESWDLRHLLSHTVASLRLAVLDVDAETSPDLPHPAHSLAWDLLESHLPAVLTAPGFISQHLERFWETFYRGVADFQPLELALALARQTIASRTGYALWALPRLYSRLTEGLPFNLAETLRPPTGRQAGQEATRDVPTAFSPPELPSLPGWQLAAALQPASQAADDFYDLIQLPEGRIGLVIGDVAGKGPSAALLMSQSRALLRVYAAEQPQEPAKVLELTNRALFSDVQSGQFVTVFYAVLDPRDGQLSYCNAGHDPPYLLPADPQDDLQALARTGMALGLMESPEWQTGTRIIAPGEALVLYTDGLTEATNPQGEFLGKDRLWASLLAQRGLPAQAILQALSSLAQAFMADEPQADDIALLVVSREAPPTPAAPRAPGRAEKGAAKLEIASETQPQAVIVHLSGRIDSATAPQASQAFKVAFQPQKALIVDLTNVDYLSSAGISALLSLGKETRRRRKRLILAGVNPRVRAPLELAGLTSLFEIYETLEAALAALSASPPEATSEDE
jgi:anti-anti-sigma factor